MKRIAVSSSAAAAAAADRLMDFYRFPFFSAPRFRRASVVSQLGHSDFGIVFRKRCGQWDQHVSRAITNIEECVTFGSKFDIIANAINYYEKCFIASFCLRLFYLFISPTSDLFLGESSRRARLCRITSERFECKP